MPKNTLSHAITMSELVTLIIKIKGYGGLGYFEHTTHFRLPIINYIVVLIIGINFFQAHCWFCILSFKVPLK